MKSVIILTALMTVLSSCQKNSLLELKEWTPGTPESKKVALQAVAVETATLSNQAVYGSKKIEIKRQLINDLPVYGSFVKVVRNGGQVELIQAQITKDASAGHGEPAADERVVNYAEELKKADSSFTKSEIVKTEKVLVIEGTDSGLYTLVSVFDKYGTPFEAFFNKKQELVKLKRAGADFSDVMTNLYPEGAKLSQLTELVLKGISAEPAISNDQVVVTTEAVKKISLSPVLKFETQDERFDQLQAFFYIDKTINWIKSNLKIQMEGQLNAVVWMGYPERTNSAFYFQNKIRLGKGDDKNYSNLPHDLSIVAHETFHAMIDRIARLPFEGEGGSLNEAFADFFTCLMLDRPYLGESSYLKGPFKRNLNNTTKLSEKTGGLYHDSLIISGALWDIKEKLGPEKAKNIAMETLIQMNPASTFISFNEKIRSVGAKQLSLDDIATLNQVLTTRGF